MDFARASRMEILDKVFAVLFARFRRQMGDANLEAAWRRASLRVSASVGWPMAATLVMVMAVFYAVAAVGSPPEHKRWGQLIAGAIGVLIAMRLERRFRPYLADPPALSAEESSSEARLVFWFRAVCYSVFGGICLIGFLLHESGVRVLQGF